MTSTVCRLLAILSLAILALSKTIDQETIPFVTEADPATIEVVRQLSLPHYAIPCICNPCESANAARLRFEFISNYGKQLESACLWFTCYSPPGLLQPVMLIEITPGHGLDCTAPFPFLRYLYFGGRSRTSYSATRLTSLYIKQYDIRQESQRHEMVINLTKALNWSDSAIVDSFDYHPPRSKENSSKYAVLRFRAVNEGNQVACTYEVRVSRNMAKARITRRVIEKR